MIHNTRSNNTNTHSAYMQHNLYNTWLGGGFCEGQIYLVHILLNFEVYVVCVQDACSNH